uniref:Ig-like domain-containing protein n=1 Tax=Globodera rostochiensis TaxID=31243 RepID=A0A914H471_GLORO
MPLPSSPPFSFAAFLILCHFLLIALCPFCYGQLPSAVLSSPSVSQLQVKISSLTVPVANAQHLAQLVWTVVGKQASEQVFCVSEAPVSQLRFVCVDCVQRNITDLVDYLNTAQDYTRRTTFPTVQLPPVDANPAWTGATIICQAAVNGGTKDSPPSVVEVHYLRGVHVVDSNGQGPVHIPNQGFHFYVECVHGPDGQCQQSAARRKTLHCSVQANPAANTFRWLKNGGVISGNGPEITIGTEMIGQSLQCAANNGLYGDDMPQSQAVSIDPYTAARLIQDNFQQVQNSAPFQSGNRVEMGQRVQMNCIVEGNPRPVVFWKLRRSNGQVVDALCPQGLNGQYREVPVVSQQQPGAAAAGTPLASQQSMSSLVNLIRLQATCDLHVANYSFSGQYWCSACSYVSQGLPECSPGQDAPSDRLLNMQVQGPPQQSETEPSVEQFEDRNSAIVQVHFCSEPSPRPPREVVFSIDGNDLQMGQQWENFHFESLLQNNTVPNCFVARLKVQPVHEDDQSRQIVLKLQNQYGAKQISVSLADLLGASTSELGGMPGWLGVLLGVAVLALLASCAVVYCVRMNLLCFDKMKNGQSHQYSSDNLKTGVQDTFTDEPSGRTGLFNGGSGTAANSENPYEAAVHIAFSDSRISSV